MRRHEIRRKLDEIVEFSGVGRFLDLPVKHYSSGMYVRLAFAVAAHVDPDILILDEVLSVGDLAFQRRCFGKIEELGAAARAVLFVTHDLSAVTSLCNRCIVLDGGRILFDGLPSEAILRYHRMNPVEGGRVDYSSSPKPVGDREATLLAAELTLLDGTCIFEVDLDQPLRVSMRYRLDREIGAPAVPNFHFYSADGIPVFVAVAPNVLPMPPGEYVASAVVPGHFLNEGTYNIGFALTTFAATHHQVHFNEQGALSVNVRDRRDDATVRYGFGGAFPGVVRPKLAWQVEPVR
jgi:lipopolysaccharide transport system ATP-binding protein